MFKRTISLVVLILFIAVVEVQAQVSIIYSTGGMQYFSMTIPDDWSVNVGTEKDLSRKSTDRMDLARLISAMPNSGVPLWFGMWVPKELEKIDGAKDYVTSLGLDLLTGAVITEIKQDTLSSMEVQYISGIGEKEGETMDFRAGFFQLSPDDVAIAIYIGPPETTTNQSEELAQMIHSLQSLIK